MVQTNLGPDYELAKRLSKMEGDIQKLSTRDVLLNATFGPDGTTVAQAFAIINNSVSQQNVMITNLNAVTGNLTTVTNNQNATIASLNTVTANLGTVTGNLTAVTNSQNTTIANLNTVTNNLNTTINGMVRADVGSQSAGGFSLSTAFTVVTSFTITIPAGYTQALVSASGVLNINSSASSSDTGFSKVTIAGIDGTVVEGEWPTSTALGMVPSFNAVKLTGLNGGTILIQLLARVGTGPANGGFANVCGSAIFLK